MRPYSTRFAEHYWSPAGVTEKTTVFLTGNQLPARWSAMPAPASFTVAELGLGTGLNFALTAALHAAHAPTMTLHYVGYEADPLPVTELAAIHAALPPPLQPWLQRLQGWWLTLQPGWNRWLQGPLKLQLWVGEALAGLPTQPMRANAWYLDGFSPAKNPDLWSLPVLQEVARQSCPGATVATYSVARVVRENLQAVGFAVSKLPGVPPKRDRLVGALAL